MNSMKAIVLTVLIFSFFTGCDSSISSDGSLDSSIKISDKQNDENLQSLSENRDINEVLQKGLWTKIKEDVSLFYENENFPSLRYYTIKMSFSKREVLTYADCQKIMARYRIKDNEITFSNIVVAPALELPVCVESQYADDAVLAFFENDFYIDADNENSIKFKAFDFDGSIELHR